MGRIPAILIALIFTGLWACQAGPGGVAGPGGPVQNQAEGGGVVSAPTGHEPLGDGKEANVRSISWEYLGKNPPAENGEAYLQKIQRGEISPETVGQAKAIYMAVPRGDIDRVLNAPVGELPDGWRLGLGYHLVFLIKPGNRLDTTLTHFASLEELQRAIDSSSLEFVGARFNPSAISVPSETTTLPGSDVPPGL